MTSVANIILPTGAQQVTLTNTGATVALTDAEAHPGHNIRTTDESLSVTTGFSNGDHYVPTVPPEPGRNSHIVYFGQTGSTGLWTKAAVATAESMNENDVNGTYILGASNTEGYGLSSDKPIEYGAQGDFGENILRYSLLTESGPTEDTISPHAMFDRGYTYDISNCFGRTRNGESSIHPIYYTSFGAGAQAILQCPSSLNQTSGATPTYRIFHDVNIKGMRVLTEQQSWYFKDCTFHDDDEDRVTLTGSTGVRATRTTLEGCNMLDAVKNEPTNADWSDGANPDRNSNFYVSHVDGLLLKECIMDHGGFADSYDPDGAYNAGANGQPPSQYSHNVYMSGENKNVTVRGCVSMRAASSGYQLRAAGHFMDNVTIDCNIGHQVSGGSLAASDWGNFGVYLDNLITSAGYRETNISNFTGAVNWGASSGTATDSVVDQYIITHLADPNNATEVSAKTGSASPAAGDSGFAPAQNLFHVEYVQYNWGDDADFNTSGLSTVTMETKTAQLYADYLLTASGSTIADLATHFRGLSSLEGVARDMWEWFADGFGYTYGTHTGGTETLTFTPWINGEGYRWDNRRNWGTDKYLPADGDTVNLDNNFVRSYESVDLAALNLDATSEFDQVSGKMVVDNLNGAGTVNIQGEFWPTAVDAGVKTLNVTDGRLGFSAATAGALDITVSNGAEVLIDSGGSLTIASGRTLEIQGDDCFVGFDGTGTAGLTIEGTLLFTVASGAVSPVDEFRSGKYGRVDPTVTHTVTLASGSAVTVVGTLTTGDVLATNVTDNGATLTGCVMNGSTLEAT